MSNVLPFERAIIPKSGTQCHTILLALQRGEKLTVASALNGYGIYALSQRIGELRGPKYGYWPIKDEMVTAPSGARVAEYSYDWEATRTQQPAMAA